MNLIQKQHKEMKGFTSMLPTFPPNLNLQETGNKSTKLSMCIVSSNNLLPKQDVARNQVVVAIKCCSKYCQNLYDYCRNCGNIAAFRAWYFWPQIYCGNTASILPQHFLFGKGGHDMTERLLKATFSPNQTNKRSKIAKIILIGNPRWLP